MGGHLKQHPDSDGACPIDQANAADTDNLIAPGWYFPKGNITRPEGLQKEFTAATSSSGGRSRFIVTF